jgi:Protein of unknown function (DUF4038)/Domain of unknown function (DUF5060)/Putative collagen-binding domain of a collagenase
MRDVVSRRNFCKGMAAVSLAGPVANTAGLGSLVAAQGCPAEWSYTSSKQYPDPFNDIDLDVVVTLSSGKEETVPAFWAGGTTWRVRYAAPETGQCRLRSICTDQSNKELHGQISALDVVPYAGGNSLYKHGSIKVAKDKRHFEQSDGTPFFWLGDTWWMGLCSRLSWPDDFQTLTADRGRKGFTVVQIVAGLYPDMEPYDPRGANEAGFAWKQDYAAINPAYFDMADVRIQYLADHGLAACVVGCWGYFLPRMGVKKMKQHWRYLIARWGAYPVVWCLAGEGTMPYYLSKTKEKDAQMQRRGWTELARYVRGTDPRQHPITIHPSSSARDCVDDSSVIDFDMLQTGHDDRKSVPNTIETLNRSLSLTPKMPVLIGEVCYEGIQEASRQEVQRFMFWSSILSGSGGHTYGANGIWQVNTREKPYGLSPHGHSWGGPPWDIAAQLPGSGQVGLAKRFLTRFSWWKLEPRPDLVTPRWSKSDYWQPYAGEIPGEAVVVYCPSGMQAIQFSGLNARQYNATFFNPSDGSEQPIGKISTDASGAWKAPEFPIFQDWVILLVQKTGT